jgi:photosystem II stability/assembly factor-like uncharacterized protein
MNPTYLMPLLVVSTLAVAQSPAPSPAIWQMQESGTTAGLRGIDSVDGTVAWASGTGGTVLRTIDAGALWTKCAVPDAAKDGATLDFRGVQAWDADIAIVMASGPGEKSRLYKTTDGCGTWKLLLKNPDASAGFFDSFQVFFKSKQEGRISGYGLLLGDPVGGRFVLLEGGNSLDSWTRVRSDELVVPGKDSVAFGASNSCLMGYYKGTFGFITGGASGAFLVRVPYGQGSWRPDETTRDGVPLRLQLPLARSGEGAGAFSIAQHLWPTGAESPPLIWDVAVGGDFTAPNENVGTAVWSTDSGEHWTASTTPPHGFRSAVQWSESLKAWITVGTNGSDISRDDGKTWQPLDDGNWNALSLPFVVGPNGRIGRMNSTALTGSALPPEPQPARNPPPAQ